MTSGRPELGQVFFDVTPQTPYMLDVQGVVVILLECEGAVVKSAHCVFLLGPS